MRLLTGVMLPMVFLLAACSGQDFASTAAVPEVELTSAEKEKIAKADTLAVEPGRTASDVAAGEEACKASGGIWQAGGMIRHYQCFMPFSDAGKPCNDGRQCKGACVGPPEGTTKRGGMPGVCQTTTNPFGCFERFENGRSAGTVCVD